MQNMDYGDEKEVKTMPLEEEWRCVEAITEGINLQNNELFPTSSEEKKQIVLFGAGMYGQFALQLLKKRGINVQFFCDNDRSKQGKVVDGVPVISPEELHGFDNPLVFITARPFVYEISSQLKSLKLNYIPFDAYFVKQMLAQFKQIYFDLLHDERSREVYIAILEARLLGSTDYSKVMESNAYWAIPEFMDVGNEIFVDAGAYVGDTIERFIWKTIGDFRRIYAFEPGDRQYAAMQSRIRRLVQEWALDSEKIVCVRAGLGERDMLLPYGYNTASLPGSNFISTQDDKSRLTQVYSLDSFIKGEPISLLKGDIEGFELEMLKGAQNLIKRFRPKLAISIYHRPEDLFEIPQYIHSLVPEYNMAIRHHAPSFMETVLYCWI